MKRALILIVVAACGGPSHGQLVETPSATEPRRQAEPPPASTSDKDRERSIQQFDDMETTQRAYQQAEQGKAARNAAAKKGQPQGPVKTGPAEQAPPEPKKKGPAEQAPPGAIP
jgi:hypothetical protein